MSIYSYILNNELKELGEFGEVLSQYKFNSVLFVFKPHEGSRPGFDQSNESASAALSLICDAWYLDRKTQKVRALESDLNSLSTVWAAVTPVATTIVEPDSELLDEFEKVSRYRKIQIQQKLYKKFGKSKQMAAPPKIMNLFEDIGRWAEDCLSFVLEHSKGLVIWRFGAGEYGLHCVAISNSLRPPNSWLVGRPEEEIVQVSALSEVPIW